MPNKVRTVRSISDFLASANTKCVVSPSLPMAAGTDIAALLFIDGASAGTGQIFGNAGTLRGWALERLVDSGLNAQFQFRAAEVAAFHTAILAVPLAAIANRCILLQASIVAQNISIGIGTFNQVTTALTAAYVPGADITSIGTNVNGGDISNVAEGTRICAVGYSTTHAADTDGIRQVSPINGDLAPRDISTWTIYSFSQGLSGVPAGAIPTGTVVNSIGGVAGTATITNTTATITSEQSPYPG